MKTPPCLGHEFQNPEYKLTEHQQQLVTCLMLQSKKPVKEYFNTTDNELILSIKSVEGVVNLVLSDDGGITLSYIGKEKDELIFDLEFWPVEKIAEKFLSYN